MKARETFKYYPRTIKPLEMVRIMLKREKSPQERVSRATKKGDRGAFK